MLQGNADKAAWRLKSPLYQHNLPDQHRKLSLTAATIGVEDSPRRHPTESYLLEINTGGQTTGMQNKPGASLSIWWLADPEDDYPLKRHSAEVAWPLNGSFDQMLDSPHR